MKNLNLMVLFDNGTTTRVKTTVKNCINVEKHIHSLVCALSKNNANKIINYDYSLV